MINDFAKQYLEAGETVVFVDTQQKENIRNFKDNGTEYRKNKQPRNACLGA